MRAALLEDLGKLRIIDTDAPRLSKSDDLLIEIGASGICGSEVHAFKGTHPFRKPPSIMGHEVAGRVIEVGAEAEGFEPGDKVAVLPYRTCGQCQWCQAGDVQLCPSRIVLGTPEWPGGFGEIITAPAHGTYRLPDHVSYVEGTLVETLAVGTRAVRRAGIKAGESVAIIGTGPIGMVISAAASLARARQIIAVDRHQHCLDIAAQFLGATDTVLANGDSNGDSTADKILTVTGGRKVDVVIMAVGLPGLMKDAFRAVNRNGRIVLVAMFDGPLQFDAFEVINPELTLIGTTGYSARDFRAALHLIGSGRVRAREMVSHVLPLADIQRGFELAETKSDRAIKVVVEM